ncbi:hypothetical protein GCM10009530_39990 [Microbispora corallina]|uniref:Uncharacterized protein n=1 Tax=Microbispora corallina TaxID=83302 RepID=A0ABQ4G8T5_9ACTN|nr:hypothetical protein [Microbispora corallina]GIH43472.1 hypothetical protein Mco01_64720 [Microbispora corallina]
MHQQREPMTVVARPYAPQPGFTPKVIPMARSGVESSARLHSAGAPLAVLAVAQFLIAVDYSIVYIARRASAKNSP